MELAPASPVAGNFVTVRITATNYGPSDAVGVTVRSAAPPGATEASGSTSKGSCAGSTNLVCSLGTLAATQPGVSAARRRTFAAGESAQVEHRFRLPTSGSVTFQATADASSADPNPADNHREVSLSVATGPEQVSPPNDGVPNPNETVVVQEVAGRVLVKAPGSSRYVDLATLTEIPNGTLVDARAGRFLLTAAAPGGATVSTTFFGGIASVGQQAPSSARAAAQAAQPGVTELRLAGGDFGRPCTTALAKAKAKKKPKRRTFGVAQAKPVKPVRRLWGNGGGNFRTRGRFSSATVRGTVWLTEDYCNGTLVRVREGAVTVRDLVKNRTVVVSAGRSYFAEAPAPKAAKATAKTAKKRRTTG